MDLIAFLRLQPFVSDLVAAGEGGGEVDPRPRGAKRARMVPNRTLFEGNGCFVNRDGKVCALSLGEGAGIAAAAASSWRSPEDCDEDWFLLRTRLELVDAGGGSNDDDDDDDGRRNALKITFSDAGSQDKGVSCIWDHLQTVWVQRARATAHRMCWVSLDMGTVSLRLWKDSSSSSPHWDSGDEDFSIDLLTQLNANLPSPTVDVPSALANRAFRVWGDEDFGSKSQRVRSLVAILTKHVAARDSDTLEEGEQREPLDVSRGNVVANITRGLLNSHPVAASRESRNE